MGKVINIRGNSKVRGGGVPWWGRCLLRPMKDPVSEQIAIPKGSVAFGEPMPEQRKRVRGWEQLRETALY